MRDHHILTHNRSNQKSIQWKASLKIGLIFTLIQSGSGNVQAMEIAGWIGGSVANYFGPKVVEYASFLYGGKKKYTEQYNEFVSSRDREELRKLTLKNLNEIKARLETNYQIPNLKKTPEFAISDCKKLVMQGNKIQLKYALAILKIDFVESLMTLFNIKIEEITKLDVSPIGGITNDPIKEEQNKAKIVKYLEHKRINLIAILCAKYEFERIGYGPVNRFLTTAISKRNRYKELGVIFKPTVTTRDDPEEIEEILNSEQQIAVKANLILKFYEPTINFINAKDSEILKSTTHNILYYKSEFYKFYNNKPTKIPLTDPLLSEYEIYLNTVSTTSPDVSSKRHTKGSQDASASFTMLTPPIPANTTSTMPISISPTDATTKTPLATYLNNCTPSQSYSASAQDPFGSLFAPQSSSLGIPQSILEQEQSNHSKESSRSRDETTEETSEDSFKGNSNSQDSLTDSEDYSDSEEGGKNEYNWLKN